MKSHLSANAYCLALRASDLKRHERIIRECIERAQRIGRTAVSSFIVPENIEAQIRLANADLLGRLDYLANLYAIERKVFTRMIADDVRESEREGGAK